jgi:hypothetical protein
MKLLSSFLQSAVLYSFSDGVCIYAWRRFPFPPRGILFYLFRFVSTGFTALRIDLGINSERFYVFLLLLMMFDEEKRIERRYRRSYLVERAFFTGYGRI